MKLTPICMKVLKRTCESSYVEVGELEARTVMMDINAKTVGMALAEPRRITTTFFVVRFRRVL